MLKEFKEFAMKGSVIDMAVGIIIGAAFSKVITSIVNDILMPPIGLLIGKMDFSNLFVNLSGQPLESLVEAKKVGAATINYGLFINTVSDFLIVALVIFLLVHQFNKLRQPAAVMTKECPFCATAIPLKAVKCGHCTSQLTPAK